MRCVDVVAGTFSATAECGFPSGVDAARVLAPRYAGAGVIVPRVDFDIPRLDAPGDDAVRKPASGSALDLSSLCASFVGSTVLSIAFFGAMGRAVSAEFNCVTSRTGTNRPVPAMLSCICAASLSNDCGAAAGCRFVKYCSCRPPLNSDGRTGHSAHATLNESVHRGLGARAGTGADICRPHVFCIGR